MKRVLKTALFLVAVIISVACNEENISNNNGSALYVDGKEILRYDEKTWQAICFSPDNTFVMATDNLASWYKVECDGYPAKIGQAIVANLSWKVVGSGENTRNGLTFKVSAIEENSGKVTLWDSVNKISVSIMCIR